MRDPFRAIIVTLAVIGTSACSEAASQPTAVDADALVVAPPDWTPASITEGLEVDAATREHIMRGLASLHASMLDLHERWASAESLEGAAHASALAELKADAQALHERHLALWNSLDEDVRDALAERMHEHMAGGHDDGHASLHERMQRLHGAVHDAVVGH